MERLFEEVFVEVCAPTLRGIKPSNLFRYQPQNRDKLLEALDFWNRELEPSGLQVRALKECSRTGAFLILVYREEWLRFILGKISVQHFLKKSGYQMQNVKGIIAKLHCDGPKTVYIEAAGEGEVKAGDIHADGEVEILNPDLHIATLMSDARLSMEITMTSGRGYVPAEKNKQHQTSIGVIPVDSIYTPVYKVNYTVENTRVRDLTDYDKLTLEVWTDATINARDAVSLGAKVLRDHLDLFVDLSEEIGSKSTVVEKAEAQHDKVLEMTIEELDFSVRSFNCLKRAGINTVEDLINTSEEDMMKVRNLGRKSLEEVIGKLEAMGLHLAKSEE